MLLRLKRLREISDVWTSLEHSLCLLRGGLPRGRERTFVNCRHIDEGESLVSAAVERAGGAVLTAAEPGRRRG